jgi:hypothetical protein
MKKLAGFLIRRKVESQSTLFARKRMALSMPGETGALAALRLTGTCL